MPNQAPAALVTGGAGGIGSVVAKQLAERGYQVHIVDQVGSAQTSASHATYHQSDLSDSTSISDVVGPLLASRDFHVVVNAAGVGFVGSAEETALADWNRVFAVNATAVFHVSALAVAAMKAAGVHGSIVNVSSAGALVGLKQRAAYCASKGAVVALTRAMAVDHAVDHIRINAVCPGTISTAWVERLLLQAPDPIEAARLLERRQLLERLGTPEEVADAVMFLTLNTFATGSVLVLDGGLTAQ